MICYSMQCSSDCPSSHRAHWFAILVWSVFLTVSIAPMPDNGGDCIVYTHFLGRALELHCCALYLYYNARVERCIVQFALYLCHEPTRKRHVHFTNMHFSMILTFIIVFIAVATLILWHFFVRTHETSIHNCKRCVRISQLAIWWQNERTNSIPIGHSMTIYHSHSFEPFRTNDDRVRPK